MIRTLGKVIYDLRKQAGCSRSALARDAGVDVSALARLEIGSRETIRFESICRLAQALDVSLDEIAKRMGYRVARAPRGKPENRTSERDALRQVIKIANRALEARARSTHSRTKDL